MDKDISLDDVSHLAEDCKGMNLDVVGLMCIPPINEQTSDFFSKIKLKNDELEFNELSLGMSNDYTEALSYKSTYIRIGTKIFGRRG